MKSTNPIEPAPLCSRRHLPAVVLLVAGLALALPAQAGPGAGHHGRGGPEGWIELHAEELGVDDATRAEISEIVAASREQAEAIYAEHREARGVLRDLLDQDEPDTAAVMKQAEVLGEIDVRKHKHRLATMLKIRAKLTREQRSKLSEMRGEMHRRHGRHHHRGEPPWDDGPPPEDL